MAGEFALRAATRTLHLLDHHRARLDQERQGYEDRYIAPEEWTIPVAAADELLSQAYQLWLDGLEQLSLAVAEDRDEFDSALELLLAGNANFLKVERLAQL